MGIVSIDPRIILVGLVVGLLTGLSGVGGGSLVTPLLVLVMGVKPLVAVGTDLLYSVPTKLLGAIVHHRQGTVNWRLVRYLVAGGLPGAVAGLITLAYLERHVGITAVNASLKHGLGFMLIAVSVAIVIKPLLSLRSKKSGAAETTDWSRASVARIMVLGAAVGFLVSLTSIGSGSLTMPLLFFLVPGLGLRRLVGSDVAFSAILIPVATAGQLHMGHVNLGLALSLVTGSLPGVYIGSRLCARVPDTWLRPALAVTLLFAGSKLI